MPSLTPSTGEVVAVTGAASGIGRTVALELGRLGTTVVALDRDAGGLDALAAASPTPPIPVVGDAATAAGNASLRSAAGRAGRLDGLVCCAGVFDRFATLAQLSPTELDAAFEEIFSVNVRGVLHAVGATQDMLRSAGGAIVVVSSASAHYAEGGGVLYGASKAALRGALLHLARDLAPEVRINAVAPGGVTGTVPGGLRALGHPSPPPEDPSARDRRLQDRSALGLAATTEDVAAAILFLLGPGARSMTGTTLHPDGGLGVPAPRPPR